MYFFFAPLVVCLFIAVYFDIKTRRIPNWLTLPGIMIGLLAALVVGGQSIFISHLVGAVILGGVWFVLWQLGMMGGGDQKLMMLVGAWLGQSFAWFALVSVAVCGGFLALAYTYRRHRQELALTWRQTFRVTRLPYSLAIAGGTIIVILSAVF
ncbi:MAG: hypothetical protein EXS55_04435 [Candidatus Magasanikbacteria bacterium]|nr:hypothetical protein [Candidatus Magasanikbacteria bacterium]